MVIGKDIVSRYFTNLTLPFWGVLLLDLASVVISYLSVLLLFSDVDSLLLSVALFLVPYLGAFLIFKTYKGIFRYASFVDLSRVGKAMVVGTAVACLMSVGLGKVETTVSVPSVIEVVAASVLATLMLWTLRMLVKTLYDASFVGQGAKSVYIYGVKSGGVGIAKHIRSEKPLRFVLKGFISDDGKTDNHILMGVKVFKLDSDLVEHMKDAAIEAVIVSPLRLEEFRRNTVFQDQLIKAGIKIYMTQEEKEWGDDDEKEHSYSDLKEISIEDLLPREEIQVDMESVAQQLTGQCILVTGSAGSIGSEMVRQIAAYGPRELLLIDQAETPQHDLLLMMRTEFPEIKARIIVASICEKEHMEAIFSQCRPSYVLHAAAYKHVPMMEDNPSESVLNNVVGTQIIADLSVKYGVKKFVMISTDKAVNPTNVMGCSKRICEIYVQSLNARTECQFVTTRFGNVLGSSGSVIPLFKEQIRKGGPITVTDPRIIRYFMLIPEACKLVLEAGAKGNGGEIFAFDMGQPVKIADLAKRMILLSGAKDIEIKYTGLRPGEKLYEEVLNEAETTKPSFHEKIRIATVRQYDYDDVCRDIAELVEISKKYDDMETVRKMKQIVPEYKSNNSIYSVLDKETCDGH